MLIMFYSQRFVTLYFGTEYEIDILLGSPSNHFQLKESSYYADIVTGHLVASLTSTYRVL